MVLRGREIIPKSHSIKQKKDTVSSVLAVAGTGLESVSAAADMSHPNVDSEQKKDTVSSVLAIAGTAPIVIMGRSCDPSIT